MTAGNAQSDKPEVGSIYRAAGILGGTHHDRQHPLVVGAPASVHQFAGHDLSPFANPALERAQLAVRKLPGMLMLQTEEQLLCCDIGLTLKPDEDLWPHRFEGIPSRPPVPAFRRLSTMGRPNLSGSPQSRERAVGRLAGDEGDEE